MLVLREAASGSKEAIRRIWDNAKQNRDAVTAILFSKAFGRSRRLGRAGLQVGGTT